MQWPKRTRTSAEMAKHVHNHVELSNKTTSDMVAKNNTSNNSHHNSATIDTVLISSESDTSSSPLTPQPQPQQQTQNEPVINPTVDVIANLTNSSVSQIRNNEQNVTTSEISKMYQSLSTLSSNACPPIPPNLGKVLKISS